MKKKEPRSKQTTGKLREVEVLLGQAATGREGERIESDQRSVDK